ncbi:hypothetical protein K0M31_005674, partial [Melipona bicolor]
MLSYRDLMTSELLDCFACSVLWVASEWIVSRTFTFCRDHAKSIDADSMNMMRLFGFGSRRTDGEAARGENDEFHPKITSTFTVTIEETIVLFPDDYIAFGYKEMELHAGEGKLNRSPSSTSSLIGPIVNNRLDVFPSSRRSH